MQDQILPRISIPLWFHIILFDKVYIYYKASHTADCSLRHLSLCVTDERSELLLCTTVHVAGQKRTHSC